MAPNSGDAQASGRDSPPDTSSVPDSFLTTIRVRRSGRAEFTATQHGVAKSGTGATPHRAIVDLVRTLERDCFD